MRIFLVVFWFTLFSFSMMMMMEIDNAFAQAPTNNEIVVGNYSNEEFGFSVTFPEEINAFLTEIDNPHTGKILNIQMHPAADLDPEEKDCCPSVDTSEVAILLDSHPLNMLATPVPLTGDIYAAFQGYDMDVSVENLGKLQVLTSTIEIEREYPPEHPEPIKRIGKFYFVNTEDRYLSYGIFASEENFGRYIDIFEKSSETLSVAGAKPIDLGAIFPNPIETLIKLKDNSTISVNVMSPSIVNSVTLKEDSKTIQISISEPNNFRSFLAVDVGDTLDGPYTVTYDENSREAQTIENESGRYLLLFYSGEGSHDITITGTKIKKELSATQDKIATAVVTNYDSPLKQIKAGVAVENIRCNEPLTIVTKHNGTPACVKPESIPKLIERGWTTGATFIKIQDNPDTKDNQQIVVDGSLARIICSELILKCDNDDESVSFVGKKQNGHDVVVHISHEERGQEYFVYVSDDSIKDIEVVTTSNIAVDYSVDENGMVDLDKIPLLFDEQYGGIDYDELGYRVAEHDLKKQLSQKNVQYSEQDYLFIEGSVLESYPPHSGYCAFVKSSEGKEYWYGGWFHKDTLSTSKVHDHNPNPCRPNEQSCVCNLQKKLAVSNLETLSYFDSSEEESVGKKLQSYLDSSNISNVSNQFVVGKYNLDKGLFVTPFCGQFVGKSVINEFEGSIQFGQVVEFSLGRIPELCAINDDAPVYEFANP